MKRRGNVISPIDSINSIVEMLIQTDSSVEDGEIVWVRSAQALFVYRVNSGLTPDNVNVIASLYGNGVWQRLLTGSSSSGVLDQATWFVDPIAGSDTNTGLTAGTALKTNAELARRWGIGTRLIGQAYSVTWVSGTGTGDPVVMDVIMGPAATLTLKGTTTVALSSTLTGFTATNRAGQVMNALVDTTVASFAAHVNKPYTITSGARAGTSGFIMAATGANTARVTSTCTSVNGVVTRTTPAAPDPYTIFNVPTISIGTMNFQLADPNATNSALFIDLLILDGQSLATQLNATRVPVFATRTNFLGVNLNCDQFQPVSCMLSGVRFVAPGIYQTTGASFIQACGANNLMRLQAGSAGSFDVDFLFQACGCVVDPGASWSFGTVAFFDNPFSGSLFVDSGAVVISENCPNGDNLNLIWGTANAGFGVVVKSNGGLLYVTKPTINATLGAGRESSVGGVDKVWGAIPFNDSGAAATGAIIAVYS